MALPFVAHSAAEYYRWVVRSQLRPDGWRFAARMRTTITLPVLQLHGARDRAVLPETIGGSAAYVSGPFENHVLPAAGHFLPEEAPEAVNERLLCWLDSLPR